MFASTGSTAPSSPRRGLVLFAFLAAAALLVAAAPAQQQQQLVAQRDPMRNADEAAAAHPEDAAAAAAAAATAALHHHQQHQEHQNPDRHRDDEMHQQLHDSIRKQDEAQRADEEQAKARAHAHNAQHAAAAAAAAPNDHDILPHVQQQQQDGAGGGGGGGRHIMHPPLPGEQPPNPLAEEEDAAHPIDPHQSDGQVRDTAKDAQALQERLLIVERLLKLKDAQVRDAVDTSRYYSDAYRSNIEKIKKLNRIVETSVKGGKELQANLDKKIKTEHELREKLEKDEEMLRQLEHSLSSARRAASDPAIALWVRRRVESLARLIQDEDSAKALGRVVGNAVDDTRKSVVYLESEVEHRVHNQGLALFACLLAILLPALFVRWALAHITKALSYRQHILLGILFNFILLSCLVSSIVIFRNDPMVTMRKLVPHYFVILQIFFVIQWPVMFFLIMHTVVNVQTFQERLRYVAQEVLFTFVVVHVLVVARPNILISAVKPAPSNLLNYVLYDMCMLLMLLLTLTGPRNRSEGLLNDVSNIVNKSVGDAVALATGEGTPFASAANVEKRRFIRVDDEVMSAISSSNKDMPASNALDANKSE